MEPHQLNSKQAKYREIEIKKKLTVTIGAGEGNTGERWERVIREHCIKDPWTKSQGEGLRVVVGVSGVGESNGRKMETTAVDQ